MEEINLKRHKLLNELSDNYIQFNSDNTDSNFKFGVSFSQLCESLNLSRDELELVCAKLYEQKEIQYTNVDLIGVHLTVEGASSLTDDKYLNIERENNLRDLEVRLVKSNINTNNENAESRKITIRNSTISVWIGVITGIALIVQILIGFFNEDKYQLKQQENKIEELLKQQDTLESKVDSLIFARAEVVQDTIRKNDN